MSIKIINETDSDQLPETILVEPMMMMQQQTNDVDEDEDDEANSIMQRCSQHLKVYNFNLLKKKDFFFLRKREKGKLG